METGLYALGILAIVYYVFLIRYTKRTNSTFSWFWPLFAVINIGMGIAVQFGPGWIEHIVLAIFTCSWIVFGSVEILILSAMVAIEPRKADYLIVLGAQVRDKKITATLKRRLDRAICYLQKYPETLCVVSGGQGKDEEISEADAMEAYLLNCGIASGRILKEKTSKTTYENFRNSMRQYPDLTEKRVGVVTSNFHIYRSMKIAKSLGYKKVYAIPAKTNIVMFLNYMVREFFAILFTLIEYKKKNESY